MLEENIVLSNQGIQVPLGRSVYLSQSDLQIRVSPGDRCTVTVLDNDPLSQRPGRLMPTAFPCDFGPREVVYSHFGSRNPPNDRIKLQVRGVEVCCVACWSGPRWRSGGVLPGSS